MRRLLTALILICFLPTLAAAQVELNAIGGFGYNVDTEILNVELPAEAPLGVGLYFGDAMILQFSTDLAGVFNTEGNDGFALGARFCPEYYLSGTSGRSAFIAACGATDVANGLKPNHEIGGGLGYRFRIDKVALTPGVFYGYGLNSEHSTVNLVVKIGYVVGAE